MKIAVLGAGKMGLSFSKSFLKYELIQPEDLHLIIRNEEKRPEISGEFPASRISTPDQVTEPDADIIIIAVKPQDFL